MGGHLAAAAVDLGLDIRFMDVRRAYGNGLFQKLLWRLASHRPAYLQRFGRELLAEADSFKPDLLLVTGLGPVDADALSELGRRGIRRATFLTDDPFNPIYLRGWIVRQLPEYDCVFTPRRANEAELREAGAKRVERLMFAYNPAQHVPQAADAPENPLSDVLFVGGADGDRVPILAALVRAGYNVSLIGAYWDRHPETRSAARGIATIAEIRRMTAASKINLILVRRANRDGHVMRTFEAAAGRGCLLVEDTAEHRGIFGPDGECVRYFSTESGMIAVVRELLDSPLERGRLADAAQRRVVGGGETYANRILHVLRTMNPPEGNT